MSGQCCFNPRAREGRDLRLRLVFFTDIIMFQSTRPRGARPKFQRLQFPNVGFNPRAREGRDVWQGFLEAPTSDSFNPRAREGRDRRCLMRCSNFIAVSIHAPARGATFANVQNADANCVSIHAPARGATLFQIYHTF